MSGAGKVSAEEGFSWHADVDVDMEGLSVPWSVVAASL